MRKSASFKNLVLLINKSHIVRALRAGVKQVRYVSLVSQVRLQNVVRVGFDAMKKSSSVESNSSATVGWGKLFQIRLHTSSGNRKGSVPDGR